MASDYVGHQFRVNAKAFVVENLVAEGGFALVFRARDVASGRVVALKRIMVNNPPDLKLAKQEVAIMRALSDHRNSVTVYDWSIVKLDSDIHEIIIVMDLYEGGTVLEMMNKRLTRGFTEKEVLAIFSDVLLAVTRLHHRTKQIIHRDLKVENILRSREGSFVLCDYGSCHITDMDPRELGVVECEEQIKRFTTLAYRSPEMVDLYSGHKITTKSDIWALGCLLYKLCFFTTPFGDQVLAIMNGQFTIPDDSRYSDELHKLIRFILEPDPQKRPDVFQVSHLLFRMKGGKNPVLNVFKSKIPDFKEISLPLRESEAKQVTAPSKKKHLAPTVIQTSVSARQRPRSGHSPNPPRRGGSGPQQAPRQPAPSQIAVHQHAYTNDSTRVAPEQHTSAQEVLEDVIFVKQEPKEEIAEEEFDPRGDLRPPAKSSSSPPKVAVMSGFGDSFVGASKQDLGHTHMKTTPISYDAFGSPVFSDSDPVATSPQPRPPSSTEVARPRPPSGSEVPRPRPPSGDLSSVPRPQSSDEPTRPRPPSSNSDSDYDEDNFGLPPFAAKQLSPSTTVNRGFRESSVDFGEQSTAVPTGGFPNISGTSPSDTDSHDIFGNVPFARVTANPKTSRTASTCGNKGGGDPFGTTPFAQLSSSAPSSGAEVRGKRRDETGDLFGSAPFTGRQVTKNTSIEPQSPWQQDTDHFGSVPFGSANRVTS